MHYGTSILMSSINLTFTVFLQNQNQILMGTGLKLCIKLLLGVTQTSVAIKHIAILKCNVFFHYCDAREISKILCKTRTHMNSIYIAGIMFVRQMNGL